jgi:hypothetical protein
MISRGNRALCDAIDTIHMHTAMLPQAVPMDAGAISIIWRIQV